MDRDNWPVGRTGHVPWGALALVLLVALAVARNGADLSLGPPRLASATSQDQRPAASGVLDESMAPAPAGGFTGSR
ncbi:hypothetical protein AB0L71_23305 [Streptomyces sp. NPDC052052]|uniref:hypothetical protein n=1 Tax=Streptomyces sp. NPDC052052 TaxID=3154756 RepID=UPI0034217441